MYGRPQNVASKFPINTFTQFKKKKERKYHITFHELHNKRNTIFFVFFLVKKF